MGIPAVFDTNIPFSATGWRGNPFQCFERARAGEIQAVTCPELVKELAEKLEARLNFSAEQVVETLADYLGFIRLVQIPMIWTPCLATHKITSYSNVPSRVRRSTL